MILVFKSLVEMLLSDKASKRFFWGSIAGLAFSIAVILSALGIMDSYVVNLKSVLKKSTGDILISSSNGFFQFNKEFKNIFKDYHIKEYSPYVQTEAFLVFNEMSKGVLLKGIEQASYNNVTHMNLKLAEGEISIGITLQKKLGLGLNDEVALIISSKGGVLKTKIIRVKVGQIINHGLHEKDARFIYIGKTYLQQILNLENKVNLLALNIPNPQGISFKIDPEEYIDNINQFLMDMNDALDPSFMLVPFWRGFKSLMRAVASEKFMIGLILQLIVLVAIFNVSAVILFFNEKRARELFLFKALGLAQSHLSKMWIGLLFIIWSIACLGALILVQVFDLGLRHLPWFRLPSDIYHLGQLTIDLKVFDYSLVFFLSAVWILVMAYFALRKINQGSILSGLRKEFA